MLAGLEDMRGNLGGMLLRWVCLMMQGLELLVHLDGVSGPQTDGWAALKALAAASTLVITEEMPTSPYAQWTQVGSGPEHSTLTLALTDTIHILHNGL